MKRTRKHVLETESRRALERLLPPEWIFRPRIPDYGIDAEIEIVEKEVRKENLIQYDRIHQREELVRKMNNKDISPDHETGSNVQNTKSDITEFVFNKVTNESPIWNIIVEFAVKEKAIESSYEGMEWTREKS